MSENGIFGLGGGSAAPSTEPNGPRFTVKPQAFTPLPELWFAAYRHNPEDPDEVSLIPVIGVATVEIGDQETGDVSTALRPFIMLPSGIITDATSLAGFICVLSEQQTSTPDDEHVESMVSALSDGEDD